MRQRGDVGYATLLDLIRVGSPNDEAIDMLCQRMISDQLNKGICPPISTSVCSGHHVYGQYPKPLEMEEAVQYFLRLRLNDDKVIALFARNADVDLFNERVVQLLSSEIIEFQAEESEPVFLLQKYS